MQQLTNSSAIFLNAIARAQRSFFSGKTAEAFESLLLATLEATASPGGFIGEVQYTRRGTPFLRTHALTDPSSDGLREFFPGAGVDLFNLDSLVGKVLTTGVPVLAASSEPGGLPGGLPPGFPSVHSFLGVPLKMTGALVGMIGLYNRPGYGPEHLRLLEDFAQICGSMIVAHTQQQLKEKAENSLRESEFRLNAIVESMVEGLITMDAHGTILSANPATETIFGWSEKDLRGQSIHRLLTRPGNKPLDLNKYLTGSAGKLVQRREATGTHNDGTRFPVDCSVSQVNAGADGPLLVALIRDITDRKRQEETLYLLQEKLLVANEKLARQSDTDPLTGVGNRRLFDERFLSELKRTARQGQSLCLFLLDVDFFKNYNDHYGHQQGDECLKAVARATAGSLNRAGEFLARIGGEEFAGIMPGTMNGADEYQARVGALIENISSLGIEHASSTVQPVVTASAGAVLLTPGPHSNPRDVFQKADEALYRAKSQGRNRVVFEHST